MRKLGEEVNGAPFCQVSDDGSYKVEASSGAWKFPTKRRVTKSKFGLFAVLAIACALILFILEKML